MFSIISPTKRLKKKVDASYAKVTPSRGGGDVRTERGDITYEPNTFSRLRKMWGITEEEYAEELSRVTALGEGAGKSKMLFWKSKNSRFFLKTMPEGEISTLMGKVLRSYFNHMKNHANSMLPRFLGMYKENGINFLVQTNIMHGLKDPFVYDLKGSVRHRRLKDFRRGEVGKDVNFGDSRIRSSQNGNIVKVLASDSDWLKRNNLMDYSLLVVMDDRSKTTCKSTLLPPNASFKGMFEGPPPSAGQKVCVHIGIIDILQKFGAVKLVERYFKTKRQTKVEESEVSAIQSLPYRKRFMNMAKSVFPLSKSPSRKSRKSKSRKSKSRKSPAKKRRSPRRKKN